MGKVTHLILPRGVLKLHLVSISRDNVQNQCAYTPPPLLPAPPPPPLHTNTAKVCVH